MRTIAVTNQKGGVGKTTTVANLGAALAAQGLDVCLIDLDPQANLTMHFGIDPASLKASMYDVLTAEMPLTGAAVMVEPHLTVIPSHIDLAAAEVELASAVGREQILRDRLVAQDLPYSLVLVDCPPSLGLLTLNALAAVEEVIIPLQPHFLALQGLGRLLETVALVRRRINPALHVSGVVFCLYESGTKLAGEVVADVGHFFGPEGGSGTAWAGATVFRTRIRRNVKLAECPSHGTTIHHYDASSRGAEDYRALAEEFLAAAAAPPAASPPAPAPPAAPQVAAAPSRRTVVGGPLRAVVDCATGRIVELVHEPSGVAFVSSATAPAGWEVFDEQTRCWYSDLQTPCTVEAPSEADGAVAFTKRFENAPFDLRCALRGDADGLHLTAEITLAPSQPQRSVRVSLVLPSPEGLTAWAPSYPPPTAVAGSNVRYCYLSDEKGKARTGIPMLTLYQPGRAGLSLVMPLDAPKTQLNLGPEPRDPTRWYVPERVPRANAGSEVDTITPPDAADLGREPVVRFTEKHIGLRPGQPLAFPIWLAGHEGHWRCGLGAVTKRYGEYFEPHENALQWAGPSAAANPNLVTDERLQAAREAGVTHAWFHGHFEFHGEFLTDAALSSPAYRWVCEPYPTEFTDLGVERIGGQIRALRQAGVGSFLYGFNMHCDEGVVARHGLGADVARNEDGSVARAYHEQPVMYFGPQTPFGAHQLAQTRRLMEVYPEILGIALDNWNYAGIDFGHDDGRTMLHDRPAASVNRSQQCYGPALADLVHATGRLLCTNKGRTIESMRGIDLVLTESHGSQTFATFAYMNVFRTVTPCEYASRDNPAHAESVLKYCLVWGAQMGAFEPAGNPDAARAYNVLLRLLRNRRWVFEPDPLTLPEGLEGQIFRIHDRSPWNAGAVVVTAVRPTVGWRDGALAASGPIQVRLADAERFTQAQWVGVEAAAAGLVACPMRRQGRHLEIDIPPCGAAGVLKLS